MYYQAGLWKVSTNIFSSAAVLFATDHAQAPDSISRKTASHNLINSYCFTIRFCRRLVVEYVSKQKRADIDAY